MISADIVLRGLTLLLYAYREVYWKIAARNADREKPKIKPLTTKGLIERITYYGTWMILWIQLLGLRLFPFPHNAFIQTFGFIIVIGSIAVSIKARIDLGTNWIGAAEHQIKKKQQLVTTGIYKYIRHPIYAAFAISFIGGELVAESYLAIFFTFYVFLGSYIQLKREEAILADHFGERYRKYMKTSKMLIPFVL